MIFKTLVENLKCYILSSFETNNHKHDDDITVQQLCPSFLNSTERQVVVGDYSYTARTQIRKVIF